MANFFLIHPDTDPEGVLTHAVVTPAGALPQMLAAAPGVSYRVASLVYASGVYTPLAPFLLFDPSDMASLFQDAAGTIPVTAAGQPVGLILDKSGNGYHAAQATAAARPLYQIDETGRPYLSFDGVDDGIVTPTITWGTDKVTIVAGVRTLSDATVGMLAELSTAANANPAFRLTMGNPASRYEFVSRGTSTSTVATAPVFPAPVTSVISTIGDIGADVLNVRVNGSSVAQSSTDQGTGNYGKFPLYIGRRGGATLPWNGRLYGLSLWNRVLNGTEISQAETWMNSKAGAF